METAIVSKTTKADYHDGLCMPSNLIVSGWQRRLSYSRKQRKRMTMISSHANRLACLWKAKEIAIVLKTMKIWMTMIDSTCQRTSLSLDGKWDFNSLENNKSGWRWWSPPVIGLDCLWMAKETLIVLKTMKVNDYDGLCMPSDLIVFE